MNSFGLLTQHTLKFFSDIYHEDYSAFLKRSLILFDELIYPGKECLDIIYKSILEEKTIDITDVKSLFRDIREFISDDELGDISFMVYPDSNMLYGYDETRNNYLGFINKYLLSKYNIDTHNYNTRAEFEIIDFYISALSSDFTFLFEMSKKNTEITALYTNLHRDAYFAAYADNIPVHERILEKVGNLNLFDFSHLSWKQIIELKRSCFISDFREKFCEWINKLENEKHVTDCEKALDIYIKDSIFNFVYKNKPNVGLTVAKEIIGNIPMPIPNPISIYSSINQIKNQVQNKKEFGWLFFIQEAFGKSKIIK